MNQELKVLLKEHKGISQLITVKNMKTGAHNPLELLKNNWDIGILQNIQTEITRFFLFFFNFHQVIYSSSSIS